MEPAYTLKKACEILKMNSTQIYRLVRAGKIRRVSAEHMTYSFYLKEDVDRIAEARSRFEQEHPIVG